MTWVPPSSGDYSGGYRPAPPGGPPYSAPPGPPVKVSEGEARKERALRALPPPPRPPAGMGAVPAFAPPVPRPNRTVLIVSLVLGATLLLCCGGGVFGVGGLLYYSYNSQQDRATAEVQSYLGDLQAGRYPQAYGRLCAEARVDRSADAFAQDEQTAGQVVGYQISDRIRVDQDRNWVVTAQVSRQGGAPRAELFPVVFETGSTASVCPR